MGTTFDFVSMSETQLQQLRRDPEQTWDFVCGRDSDPGNRPSGRLNMEYVWGPLLFLLTDPAFHAMLRPDQPDISLFLEGEGMTAANVGGCQCLFPEDVSFAAYALASFSRDDLRRRFDSPRYLKATEEDAYRVDCFQDADSFDELADYYEAMTRFFQSAASRGDAVIYHYK